MDGDKTVTASFIPLRKLQVTMTGAGTGSLLFEVDGIDLDTHACTNDPGNGKCKEVRVAHGDSVKITARPNPSNTLFGGWSGACSARGGADTCTVSMDGNKTATADFPVARGLTLIKAGTGIVRAAVGTQQQTCAAGAASCAYMFPSGTQVTLIAEASGGGTPFTGWSGAGIKAGQCTGTGPCTVTMDAAKTVIATFGPPQGTHRLNVTRVGSGGTSLTQTGKPERACAVESCFFDIENRAEVTLTATNVAGWRFTGWSGAGIPPGQCTGTSSCTLIMDAARNVTATFTVLRTLTVTRQGVGRGSLSYALDGIPPVSC
jgi:hypothetical protein